MFVSFNKIDLSIGLGAKKLKSASQQPTQATVVRTDIKGRLLTPEEGCGYSKAINSRIVGGSAAKNGKNHFNMIHLV